MRSFYFRQMIILMIVVFMLAFGLKCVHWWWLACNSLPDPLYLITTDDVAFKAGGQNVILPKGFVLYPVSEQDAKDECYPGAHYKIYVSLENSSQQLKAIAWPKGRTNLIERLTK